MMGEECRGHVGGSFGLYRCSRKATVNRGGNWYCWQHDPERVARDQEKRNLEWKEDWDRKEKERARVREAREETERRSNVYLLLITALQQIASGHNDPRAVALKALENA